MVALLPLLLPLHLLLPLLLLATATDVLQAGEKIPCAASLIVRITHNIKPITMSPSQGRNHNLKAVQIPVLGDVVQANPSLVG